MSETTHLSQKLTRLRDVFRETLGVELTDTDLAEMAGLDTEECRILLSALQQAGAIERLRGRVFVCRPTSWWASSRVRS
jgi:transcription initiation factor IIE alpha subunit